MRSISPVFTEQEVQFEKRAEDANVTSLPVSLEVIDPTSNERKILPDWGISLRFRLDDEERAAVAAGADLVATQLVFGKPLAPMNLQFCAAGEKPVFGGPLDIPVAEQAPEPASKVVAIDSDATGAK